MGVRVISVQSACQIETVLRFTTRLSGRGGDGRSSIQFALGLGCKGCPILESAGVGLAIRRHRGTSLNLVAPIFHDPSREVTSPPATEKNMSIRPAARELIPIVTKFATQVREQAQRQGMIPKPCPVDQLLIIDGIVRRFGGTGVRHFPHHSSGRLIYRGQVLRPLVNRGLS